MTCTALIAIGGNALVREGEDGSLVRQSQRAAEFGAQLAELVEEGWRIVVSHGNGPQVGYILRRGELVAPEAVVEGLPNLQALNKRVVHRAMEAMGMRDGMRATADINALGFHQRASKEYFAKFAGGVTQALDARDSSFGDYRTGEK